MSADRLKELGKRIRAAREAKGWSQVRLGQAIGQSQGAVSFWEKGEREPGRDMVARIAAETGVPLEQLEDFGTSASDSVEVVGYVSAGAALLTYGAGQGPFDTVPAPRHRTDNTVAVVVQGTSLGPAFDESIVFYDDVRSPVTEDQIGRLCVVGLPDDRILVKVLRKGEGGRFHLLSNTAEEPLWNQEVAWAARVTEVRPR